MKSVTVDLVSFLSLGVVFTNGYLWVIPVCMTAINTVGLLPLSGEKLDIKRRSFSCLDAYASQLSQLRREAPASTVPGQEQRLTDIMNTQHLSHICKQMTGREDAGGACFSTRDLAELRYWFFNDRLARLTQYGLLFAVLPLVILISGVLLTHGLVIADLAEHMAVSGDAASWISKSLGANTASTHDSLRAAYDELKEIVASASEDTPSRGEIVKSTSGSSRHGLDSHRAIELTRLLVVGDGSRVFSHCNGEYLSSLLMSKLGVK